MKLARSSLLALALSIALVAPASAHQPVVLSATDAKLQRSLIFVDGTVSWAVTADLPKSGAVRYFRFALTEGEALQVEYLIKDRKPERTLTVNQLPKITVTTPSGRSIPIRINERTKFFEPYSKTRYLFLSRIAKKGEAGIYSVAIRAASAASVIVAIGSRETRSEALRIGTSPGNCPLPIGEGVEIPADVAGQLVGLSERAASVCATANRWSYRIASRDGESFPLTMDYRFDRLNFKIEDGNVIDVIVG